MLPKSNKLTIIVLGRSGSGKGTQAQFVLRRLKKQGVAHLETGRFLRNALKKYDNPTVNIAKRVIGGGKLLPDWFAAYAILKEIVEKGVAVKHWVFDGAPRSLWQAKLIDDLVAWHDRPLPLAVYLEVGEKEATGRLRLRSRTDDRSRSIENRMRFFSKSVWPAICYYQRQGRLLKIKGEQPVGNVWRDLNSALAKRLGKQWRS